MSQQPGRRRTKLIRFGLRGLLLAVVVLSLIAGAYRYGYEQGRRDGPVIPSSLDYHRIYLREYDVSDLVTPPRGQRADPDAVAMLIQHLTKWATSSDWAIVGGYATIDPGEAGDSVVVNHSFVGHAAILEQLSTIRGEYKSPRPPKDLETALADVDRALEAERR